MSSTIYAKQNGTWQRAMDIVKTATDWEASEIVLIGDEGLEALSARLKERWMTFQIPMKTTSDLGLEFPPFIGSSEVDEAILDKVTDEQVVIVDRILNTVRAVPLSKAP